MKNFFGQLRFYLEDVQEDIMSANLDIAAEKVGDFGCGIGLTTLSLMITLNSSETIGIDKDSKEIHYAKRWIEQAREYLFREKPEGRRHLGEIESSVYSALKRGELEFRKGDITTGENLPTELDLAYCKRILTPIYLGEYDNILSNEAGVRSAVEKIAWALKPGGRVIAVEKASGIDFRPFFEQSGLSVVSFPRFERGDIGNGRRITLYKDQCIRYVCIKR